MHTGTEVDFVPAVAIGHDGRGAVQRAHPARYANGCAFQGFSLSVGYTTLNRERADRRSGSWTERSGIDSGVNSSKPPLVHPQQSLAIHGPGNFRGAMIQYLLHIATVRSNDPDF